MDTNHKTDKACIEKILKYMNDIRTCISHFNIDSFEVLQDKRLAQLAITQSITNIHEVKRLIDEDVLDKMPTFAGIKLSAARNIASHDYENVNFRIIYDVCKKLTASDITEELENEYNNL